MTATKFAQIVNQHSGTITAQNDQNLARVEFRSAQRLYGFYDEMFSRRHEVTIEGNAVLVQL